MSASRGPSGSERPVALCVGDRRFEVGEPAFLKSFFSTIFVRLEEEEWGSRFPSIMNDLYVGRLAAGQVGAALEELAVIERELSRYPVTSMVWDWEHPQSYPSWWAGSHNRVRLRDFFFTSQGRDLFAQLRAALLAAEQQGCVLEIR